MKIELLKPIPTAFARDIRERILLLSEGIESLSLVGETDAIVAVELELDVQSAEESGRVQDLVQRVGEDVHLASRKIRHKTLHEAIRDELNRADPHHSLLEAGHLIVTAAGEIVCGAQLAQLLEALDRLAHDVFHGMGCVEQMYPMLLDARPLFDLNYFHTMGQHIFYPVSLRGDYDVVADFTQRNARSSNPARQLEFADDSIGKPRLVLSPSVCFHTFSGLQNASTDGRALAFTGANKCLREERSAVRGLERLRTFNMREAVFVGSEAYVAEQFQRCVSAGIEVFEEKLGLMFRIRSANDPFFGPQGSANQFYQTAHNLKLEIQTYLPYADSYIASGSINNHMDKMAKAFELQETKGTELHSMCFGIGMERLALTLLAQTGLTVREAERFVRSKL